MDTTQYYSDVSGNYIGGFDGAAALALVPNGSVQVPLAPECAWYTWDFTNLVWIAQDQP